jgi:hypothetical protein
VLVERPCKETLQQLVVIDGLSNNTTNKLKVTKVIGVTMRSRVGLVGDAVSGRSGEKSVIRVEHLTRHDKVPFT